MINLTIIHHHCQSPDSLLSQVMFWPGNVPQERIDRRRIMKSSFVYDDGCCLLNAIIRAIQKLVEGAELQRVFHILSDVLRLVLRRWDSSCLAIIFEHASHELDHQGRRDAESEA